MNIPAKRILQSVMHSKTDDGTHGDGHKNLVQPSLDQPVLHCNTDTPSQPSHLPTPSDKIRQSPTDRLAHQAFLIVQLHLSTVLARTRHISMTNQKGGEHEEGEAEAVVGTRLGRDDLAEIATDELVGEGPLELGCPSVKCCVQSDTRNPKRYSSSSA